MAWSIKPAGSWGVATSTAPGSETSVAMGKPGSWLHDANAYAGSQRVFVRKDQWGTLAATPLFENIIPNSGLAAGGTAVSISGSGLTGSTGVTFGGTAATSFVVVGDHQITCVTPAKAAGAVNVVVANPRGNQTLTGGYTYV